MRFSEVLSRVIEGGHAIQEAHRKKAETQKTESTDDSIPLLPKPFPDDWKPGRLPEEKAMKDYLMSLSIAEQKTLITLMYLGRGDAFRLDQLCDQYEEVSNRFPTSQALISQMLGKPFHKFLTDARQILIDAKIDLDSLDSIWTPAQR